MHSKAGNTEWSGELITREEGTINDLDGWKIIGEEIFLVDIGAPGYTAYEVDKGGFKAADIVELYDAYPGLLDGTLKNHHIHTHHNMEAFFSGTDWQQLEDRGVISNYFLMLIVNFKKAYKAKVAFKAHMTGDVGRTIHFSNNADGYNSISLVDEKEKDTLVVMDCKIIFPMQEEIIDEALAFRYAAVKKALAEEDAKTPIYRSYNYGKYPSINKEKREKFGKEWVNKNQGELPFDQKAEDDDGRGWYNNDEGWERVDGIWVEKKQIREKSIMSMTNKEFTIYENNNASSKFDRRDGYALINAALDHSYSINVENPIRRLLAIAKTLKSNNSREEWVEMFILDLRDYFDMIFINKNADDYAVLLELFLGEMTTHNQNILIKDIIEEIIEEIEVNKLPEGV